MPELRAALEAAIAEDFDDLSAHMAYGDLLAEQGDPRGELIQVQLALEAEGCTGPRRAALKYREMLLYEHEHEWLGPLGPALRRYAQTYGAFQRVSWSRGWVEEVEVPFADRSLTRALARCPAARFLRRLSLVPTGLDDLEDEPGDNLPPAGTSAPCLHPLLTAPFLPHLRFLRIGVEVDLDAPATGLTGRADGAVQLLARTPRLEEVELLAPGVDLPRLFVLPTLPRLRALAVCRNFGEHPLWLLAGHPGFPALQTLRLFPASGSGLTFDEVVPLLRSPHFPALRHLHLNGCVFGDAGCAEIVRCGILARLETLDLRHGRVSDAGARTLAGCPELANLRRLSLEDNELTQAGREWLRARLGDRAEVNRQNEPGSNTFLYAGDME